MKGIKAIAYPFYDWDYLEFNCYDKASSLGNPVLRDWRFRNALNYAIDKQRLCELAYDGLAQPATTIIPPNTWVNPDYHWQPPASQAYTFDLAKANQLLTAAGYPLKNGVRLNKQGKPIVLRLEATTDQPECQIEAKLIAGWLQQLGLTIKLSVVDSGALDQRHLQRPRQHLGAELRPGRLGVDWLLRPRSDIELPHHRGDRQPRTSPTGRTLSTTSWRSSRRAPSIRSSARHIIWQMQQIMYQQSPWIPMTYPDNLEAVNTAKWTGWTQLWGTGPAWKLRGQHRLLPQSSSRGTRRHDKRQFKHDADRRRRRRRDCRGGHRFRVRAAAWAASRGRGLSAHRRPYHAVATLCATNEGSL